jgi:ankyrin repeat protein
MYYVFQSHADTKKAVTQHFIDQLGAAGLNGKQVYENNNTLAHIAIEKNSVFLLEKAIEMGADINFKNAMYISPLHLAAMKATSKKLMAVLLEHGASKNTLTEFNESPYDLALQNELLTKENINLDFLKME